MSIIRAGTTTTTALTSIGNTDGTIQLQVNGTTPSVTLNTLGAVGVGASPNFGTSGQVLISGGPTAAPIWATPTAVNLATGVTGTLPIANGGTGQTTRQAALDALAGAVTAGQYLRGDGTDVVMSAIQAADVPTLNQNTTGTAANVTGTVAVANGGTGATTLTANNVILGNGTSAPLFVAPGTTGNILTASGGTWVSAAPGGASAMVLLQSVNGTSASSWEFLNVFSSTYNQYLVVVEIFITSGLPRLDWRARRGGSLVTTDYNQHVGYAASSTLDFINNTGQPYGTNSYSTNSGQLVMQLLITNVNSTARRMTVIGTGIAVNFIQWSGSYQLALATTQGITFFLNSGFATGNGNIRIYGLVNS